ncbi:MAG: proteasome assembly chaperone family protein [Candidatus Aenigmatarchaeota archaeon]|nr:MAG: proteasome assembly chaperone family protein [Candidatus Aenigmarchaeota archaeon]
MTVIKVFSKPKLRNAVMIEGLPGVGNIGRVAAGYLVEELKAKKFAELYSKWFFPFVMLHKNYKIHLLKNEFYYVKAKKKGQRDLVFLVGDCQSLSPQGHYEVAEKILDFMEKVGVKEIITIGGLATGELEGSKKVIGAVTDDKYLARYKKYKIDFEAGEKVGYIVGAVGLLLGLWKQRDKEGLCLLGQTTGFPIVTDPKAAENVLDVLMKILKIKIDMRKLDKKVKEMEYFIKKVEALQKRALMEITKGTEEKGKKGEEQTRYIG